MTAGRNPDGDGGLWYQAVMEARGVVKRRLAPRGTPVAAPSSPYLVVPILGQSNAQGMGLGLDLAGPDRPHPLVHQWAMGGRSKGTVVAAVDPLLHEVPAKDTVGFGMTFAKQLAERTGRPVLLIPGARGDTSFAPKNGYTWDPANIVTRGQPVPGRVRRHRCRAGPLPGQRSRRGALASGGVRRSAHDGPGLPDQTRFADR